MIDLKVVGSSRKRRLGQENVDELVTSKQSKKHCLSLPRLLKASSQELVLGASGSRGGVDGSGDEQEATDCNSKKLPTSFVCKSSQNIMNNDNVVGSTRGGEEIGFGNVRANLVWGQVRPEKS